MRYLTVKVAVFTYQANLESDVRHSLRVNSWITFILHFQCSSKSSFQISDHCGVPYPCLMPWLSCTFVINYLRDTDSNETSSFSALVIFLSHHFRRKRSPLSGSVRSLRAAARIRARKLSMSSRKDPTPQPSNDTEFTGSTFFVSWL